MNFLNSSLCLTFFVFIQIAYCVYYMFKHLLFTFIDYFYILFYKIWKNLIFQSALPLLHFYVLVSFLCFKYYTMMYSKLPITFFTMGFLNCLISSILQFSCISNVLPLSFYNNNRIFMRNWYKIFMKWKQCFQHNLWNYSVFFHWFVTETKTNIKFMHARLVLHKLFSLFLFLFLW